MKTCTKCSNTKEYICFSKSKQKKDGYNSWCKECVKAYQVANKEKISAWNKEYSTIYQQGDKYKKFQKEYRVKNKDRLQEYSRQKYRENPDLSRERARQSYKRNADKRTSYQKELREKFPELIKERQKKYRQDNIEKVKETDRQTRIRRKAARNTHDKLKRQTDPQFNLQYLLRIRIWKALKRQRKSKVGSAIKDLGCTADQLKLHLENKFYNHPKTNEIMSWENQGKYGWHIDHIKPLASFDLSNQEQFKQACHYTNLQPLWAEENLQKGSKIP